MIYHIGVLHLWYTASYLLPTPALSHFLYISEDTMNHENSTADWSPEGLFLRLYKKIPAHILLTFVSALAFGLVTHLYMLTNKLPNHDDIGHLFGSDYGAASGRWLLPFVLRIHGSFSLPWLIGLLALVFLGLSACLTVSVLRIRRPLGCILTAALMVSFPSVAATFAYMFSADAYFFSLLLACLAGFLACKFRWGWVFAILPLTLSMGIYQSYFGVAAVLMVGALIFETLDGKLPLPRLFLRALGFVISLGVSMGLYLAISKLASRATGLVDYMGISGMGKLPLAQLPELLVRAYGEYFLFFLRNQSTAHAFFMKYLFVLAVLASLYLLVFILRQRKLKPLSILFFLLLLLAYPLAGGLIVLMAPETSAHLLMLYGLLYILLLPLALMEYAHPRAEKVGGFHRFALAASSWLVVLTLAASAYCYAVYSNEVYLKMQLSYEQTVAFSTRLLSAVEQTEGYVPDMPIVLVGTSEESAALAPELNRISMIGALNMNALINSYTNGLFLQRYLGISNEVFNNDTDIAQEFDDFYEVIEMPVYPAQGSIRIIDDYAVVRLGKLLSE